MPNLGTHTSLLATDLTTTFTCLFRSHSYKCSAICWLILWRIGEDNSTIGMQQTRIRLLSKLRPFLAKTVYFGVHCENQVTPKVRTSPQNQMVFEAALLRMPRNQPKLYRTNSQKHKGHRVAENQRRRFRFPDFPCFVFPGFDFDCRRPAEGDCA